MKVILIGGYPGVGKSTLMRKVVEQIPDLIPGSYEHITYSYNENTIVLGRYDNKEKFPGTDKFPMNVQPEFTKFLELQKSTENVILLEGDRLFNGKTIAWLQENRIEYMVGFVKADQKLIEERRNKRSEQNESWRKGRQTKVDNIEKQLPMGRKLFLVNDNDEQMDKNVSNILEYVKGMSA